MDYPRGPHGLPVRRPPTTLAQDEEARKRLAFDNTVGWCMHRRLLVQRFRIHTLGYQVLTPILAYLGWTADDTATPEGPESDALDEPLLLLYEPGSTILTITDFLVALFSLFSDVAKFGRIRMGETLLSQEGGRVLRAAAQAQPFTEREVLLILAVRIRDRLLARGTIRDADIGLRLTHAKRAAIAARFGPR